MTTSHTHKRPEDDQEGGVSESANAGESMKAIEKRTESDLAGLFRELRNRFAGGMAYGAGKRAFEELEEFLKHLTEN